MKYLYPNVPKAAHIQHVLKTEIDYPHPIYPKLVFLCFIEDKEKSNGDIHGLKLNWSVIYYLCNLIKLFKLPKFRFTIYEMIVILIYFIRLLRIVYGISHKKKSRQINTRSLSPRS